MPSTFGKLALALILFAGIVLSTRARAPRRAIARAELRGLVAGALVLYAVGTVGWLTGHHDLAALVYAAGIATAAFAAWVSRGVDTGEEPRDEGFGPGPDDEDPEPPSGPVVDWDRFEQDLWDYAERSHAPVAVLG